jgi:hypothetical protein
MAVAECLGDLASIDFRPLLRCVIRVIFAMHPVLLRREFMKHAALGFRAHSGWTALVAISLEEDFPLVILRERPHLVKTFTYEFRQPYHTAEQDRPPKLTASFRGFVPKQGVSHIESSTLFRRIFTSRVMKSRAAVFFLVPEGLFQIYPRFWHLVR